MLYMVMIRVSRCQHRKGREHRIWKKKIEGYVNDLKFALFIKSQKDLAIRENYYC